MMAPRRFQEPVYTPPRPRGQPRKVVGNETGNGVDGGSSGAASDERLDGSWEQGRAQARQANAPSRLLDVQGAAAYLCVSPWTIRAWVAAGALRRVRFLLPNGHEVRKLLLDREDLDRFIDVSKDVPDG